MKLDIPRSFDTGFIRQAFQKAGIEGADDFFTYLQEFSLQIVNAIRGALTIEENLNSDVRTLELKHNVTTTIQLTTTQLKKTPKHIFPTKAVPFANSITAFNWQMDQNGFIEIHASFTGAPTSAVQVTMVILF